MVKMKHHERLKLEFRWKGPYHVVDVGHPGTYWIMTPQGLRLPNAVIRMTWLLALEEIVASLTDRLCSLEIENQALQQGIRPENLREPKAALPDKF
ncbi:hypothetical protein BASA83_012962 [Batrachochytrium salamandrivorans]|nr:hypothetical protein BASA83_012962 [Batrachochytrium salamandrivorans]